jgi:hypothetical protein
MFADAVYTNFLQKRFGIASCAGPDQDLSLMFVRKKLVDWKEKDELKYYQVPEVIVLEGDFDPADFDTDFFI